MVIAFTAQAFWYGIEEIYISIQFEMQTDDKQMYQGVIPYQSYSLKNHWMQLPFRSHRSMELR